MTPSKIFGIGLSKTGTTSLATALQLLGYRAIHYPPLPSLRELLGDFDAATDTSVACSYCELDQWFPGSKFILTIREIKSWLRSARRHFENRPPRFAWERDLRCQLYGTPEWDEGRFRSAYFAHHTAVKAYFAVRPEDLLVLDLVGGTGWAPLCRFLGRTLPEIPFPKENVDPVESAANSCLAID